MKAVARAELAMFSSAAGDALLVIGGEQVERGGAARHRRQLPAEVVGVLDAAIAAAGAEGRDDMRGVAGKDHPAVHEFLQPAALEGIDRHPVEPEIGGGRTCARCAAARSRDAAPGRGRRPSPSWRSTRQIRRAACAAAPTARHGRAGRTRTGVRRARRRRARRRRSGSAPRSAGRRNRGRAAGARSSGRRRRRPPSRHRGGRAVRRLDRQGGALRVRRDACDAVPPAQLDQPGEFARRARRGTARHNAAGD